MKNFNYYAPTEVVFGDQSEEQVALLVKKYGGTKVLVHYGGKSAVRSGLLDKICGLLQEGGVPYVTLGGVVPNPRLSLAQQGIDLCRKEEIDFILAIGGGSVIDSAKCIGYGVPFEGNVWDIYMGKAEPKEMLPVAAVLTIPAAGSEMSESSVITNEDGDVKVGYSNNLSRPKFAILNPRRTMTLPPYQTAAGVTDMMMHTMERYFTKDDDMDFTTDLAEAALRSIKNAVFPVLKDPEGTAEKGIQAMERFYHAIGMPINIKELIGRDITDEEIKEMARKCSRDNTITCGALKVLQAPDMEAIYKMARG